MHYIYEVRDVDVHGTLPVKSDQAYLDGLELAHRTLSHLAATVANLTLVAAKACLPANTGCGSSAGNALPAGTIRSALEIVPARLAQILTLALLASASLPEYIFPYRASRPDF